LLNNEKKLQAEILRKLGSRSDIRLFRNSVGFGYTGTVLKRENSVIVLSNARPATFGLCPGSADLIGIQRVLITPEMIGQEIGKFLSIEVKGQNGRISEQQDNWKKMVEKMGGYAVFAKSLEDCFNS
jgi:hypothetical protein